MRAKITTADEVKHIMDRLKKIRRDLNGPPRKCVVPACRFTSAKADDFRCRTSQQGEELWICGDCARRLYERGVRTAPIGSLLRAELQTLEKRLKRLEEVDIDAFVRDQFGLGPEEVANADSLVAPRDEGDRIAEVAKAAPATATLSEVNRGANGGKPPRKARRSLFS